MAAAPAVAGAALLLVGGWTARAAAHRDDLQHHGARAAAEVLSVESRPVGRSRTATGSVVVAYDHDGRRIETVVPVGTAVSRYRSGQELVVVVDPDDPSRAQVPGVVPPAPGPPPVLALVAGTFGLVAAVVAGRHVHLLAAAVRRQPWLEVHARLVRVPASFGWRRREQVLLQVDAPDGARLLEPLGLNRFDPAFEPHSWMAADAGRRTVVVARPGGGHLVLTRPLSVQRRRGPSPST
jgi:hypothetical protein